MMRPEELRTAMDELGIDRHELAHALGVSSSAVRHWLSGRHRIPTPAAKLLRLWVRRDDIRPSAPSEVHGEELLR